jgi:hypothetical protein
MNRNIATTLRTIVTAGVGAAAIAAGALTLSAPASAATSIQQTCEQHPGSYAAGAVKGVYSTVKRGWDRDQICKVYDANGKLLGTTTVTDYYFYRLAGPIAQPPVKSAV